MEWNISLAIFLATKRVLCLEAIFSVFWLLASAGWRKTILISVRSTGPRPLVLNCAGLASAAANEPDCWAGNRWGGSGMSTLAQPRWAPFIWGHVLLPSWGLWHVLSPGFARSQVSDMSFSKGRCN